MALALENLETIKYNFDRASKHFGFSRKQFHADLKKLREVVRAGNVPHKYVGICYNVKAIAGLNNGMMYYAAVAYYARNWPKHSGYPSSPVMIHDLDRYSPSWSGECGKRRMELLDYLIHVTR